MQRAASSQIMDPLNDKPINPLFNGSMSQIDTNEYASPFAVWDPRVLV